MLAARTVQRLNPPKRKRILQRTLFFLISVFIVPLAAHSVCAHKIDVIIGAVVKKDGGYTNLIALTNKHSEQEIAEISKILPYFPLSRGALELMILTRALNLSGLDFNLVIKRMPVQSRTLSQLISGQIHLSSETLWVEELARQQHPVNTTAPIIGFGEIEKGLYTSRSKAVAYSRLSVDELKKLRVSIVKQWQLDIDTLKSAGFNNLVYVTSRHSMLDFVDLDRADVTLKSFTADKELIQKRNNPITLRPTKLVPIPNIKIGIADSRAFVVSRTAPNSKIVEEALNRGIDIMLASGEIHRALVANGIVNSRVDSWTDLNPRVDKNHLPAHN